MHHRSRRQKGLTALEQCGYTDPKASDSACSWIYALTSHLSYLLSDLISYITKQNQTACGAHSIFKALEPRMATSLKATGEQFYETPERKAREQFPLLSHTSPPPAPPEHLTFGEPKVHFSFLISIACAISSHSLNMSSRYAKDTSRVISAFSSARERKHGDS